MQSLSVFVTFFSLIILTLPTHASLSAKEGITVTHQDGNKSIELIVMRAIPPECRYLPINNDTLWTGNYANPTVPKACTSTFIHTAGGLQPMTIGSDVETYGELEVLSFLKELQYNKNLALIDGRKPNWYRYMTIPGAVNMPYHYFKYREKHPQEFQNTLKTLGVQILEGDDYEFDHAKTVVIFCNGAWCAQSEWMIHALIDIGYPEEKIKWYRGGLQSWLASGMTTYKKGEQ